MIIIFVSVANITDEVPFLPYSKAIKEKHNPLP